MFLLGIDQVYDKDYSTSSTRLPHLWIMCIYSLSSTANVWNAVVNEMQLTFLQCITVRVAFGNLVFMC